jgi:hypothetical protein
VQIDHRRISQVESLIPVLESASIPSRKSAVGSKSILGQIPANREESPVPLALSLPESGAAQRPDVRARAPFSLSREASL